MQALNLPTYLFNIKHNGKRNVIFDIFRRKFITLTPEEWVRQNFARYLVEEKKYPSSLLHLEASFVLYNVKKRADILIYNRNTQPVAIVECKAAEVELTQSVFEQIVRYNLRFKLNYILVTNGLKHFCCKLNHATNGVEFLPEIPDYELLIQ